MSEKEYENFKESVVRGFKKWLESIDIEPENFDKDMKEADMYDFILLVSLFDNYRIEVQQAIAQQQQNEKEQYEEEKKGREKANKKQEDKKDGNIITPNFKK